MSHCGKQEIGFPLNRLYETLEISKQAVYQYSKRQIAFEKKIECLILEAEELREEHPGCGVEKMYYALRPNFIGICYLQSANCKLFRYIHRSSFSNHSYFHLSWIGHFGLDFL